MLLEKKDSNGRLGYSEGKVGICQNVQLFGRVLTSEVGRRWCEAGFSCAHFKCAVKVGTGNATESSELLATEALLAAAAFRGFAKAVLDAGKRLLTKTISVKEKGGEGQLGIVLLRK